MDEELLIQKVAFAIYGASSPFTMLTVFDAKRMAEAAVQTVLAEVRKADRDIEDNLNDEH
jgi:hypothetical protein